MGVLSIGRYHRVFRGQAVREAGRNCKWCGEIIAEAGRPRLAGARELGRGPTMHNRHTIASFSFISLYGFLVLSHANLCTEQNSALA